jgi:hypothetical protein
MLEEYYKVPVKIISEGNNQEHWTKKHKRKKKIQTAIYYFARRTRVKPPCTVTLTRIAPRKLDDEDNLRTALKSAKDAVADILHPGMAPGRADGIGDIEWRFDQIKGDVREYALGIHLIAKE